MPTEISPSITHTYLNSYKDFLDPLCDIFNTKTTINLHPKPLEGTPYYLACYCLDSISTIATVFIVLADQEYQANTPYLTERNVDTTYMALTIITSGKTAYGYIQNKSKNSKLPIRNFSGIIAPVEDGICSLLSMMVKPVQVTRKIRTSQGNNSTLVQNYLYRDYAPTNNKTGEGFTITKAFSSQ